MTTKAAIINRLTSDLAAEIPQLDLLEANRLIERTPGWSNLTHYLFFRAVLAVMPNPRILVCGVYHGLDLALINLAVNALQRPALRLVGVDLFSAEPCADWPAEKRHLSWKEAFDCEPPSIEAARRNCRSAEIMQANSVEYLRAHAHEFDFIYLDTSHDYKTVRAELEAISAHSDLQHLIVAGDDYSGPPGSGWGVAKACDGLLPAHTPLFNRLWLAEI